MAVRREALRAIRHASSGSNNIEPGVAMNTIEFRLPSTGRDRPWQLRQRGTAMELNPQYHVRVNDTESLVDALKLGMGLCQPPEPLVADELACGHLVELLPSCRPESMPISIVYPSGRLLPTRVE